MIDTPSIMMTSVLVETLPGRKPVQEWFAAVKDAKGYLISHYKKKGMRREKTTPLGRVARYNDALLLLDHFELGDNPVLSNTGETMQAAMFPDHTSAGGLYGKMLKDPTRFTIETTAALDTGAHYSLFPSDLGDFSAPPVLAFKVPGLRDTFSAYARRGLRHAPKPLNRIRTRKARHKYSTSRPDVYTDNYYVAEQDTLTGLWDIHYYAQNGAGIPPSRSHAYGRGLEEEAMWKDMHRCERSISAQKETDPAIEIEDGPQKLKAGDTETALYFGLYLPSNAHAILAMTGLDDKDGRHFATSRTTTPKSSLP